MAPFTVELEPARAACLESVHAFVRAVDATSEHDLLGASRCHGWTRLDVVVHVIAGWGEMLGGLVSLVDDDATVDAASYWPAFAEQYGGGDPVPSLMAQRRRTATYPRPSSAVEHLRDVAAMLARGVEGFGARPCTWQGHVFTAGDFLAIWAVEDVVHHLDLAVAEPAPAAALAMARETVAALVGGELPPSWTDEQAVLVGTGRAAVPDDAGALGALLPALG